MPLSRIPIDISKLIISRLPVKSVLACKCVCKSWLKVISCLISDPDFVQMHLDSHRENSTRLMFGHRIDDEDRTDTQIHSIGYDSLASLLLPKIEAENGNSSDDVEMDYWDSSSTLNGIYGYISQMDYPFKDSGLTVDFFGSCNGILCLWFHDYEWGDDQEQFFCLWNPATNEYKRISEAPKRYNYWDITLHAFVYDPTAADYKFIIAVSSEDDTNEMRSLVHAYSLASDSWKSFLTPYDFYYLSQKSGVLFNGDLHWLGLLAHSIVCLDITNEEFNEIQLPLGCGQLYLVGVLEECLCVLVADENDDIHIWAMQVYGDPKSWTKRYTVTHEIMTSRIFCHGSYLSSMWSFKSGVILFEEINCLCLYDPEHGRAIECKVNYGSVENYSESLVSLNSGTYVGGRTANSSYTELEILRYWNSVLEERITELEERNAELQTKLHESQVAQKEAEESKKDELGGIAMTKKNGRKRKEEHQYNTRASKAVAVMVSSPGESTIFDDESVTVQQRAEKEQPKLVLLQNGGTLEPYQIEVVEGSKTHSTSKDTYQSTTVKTLRDLLKERGLMVKGKKDELIARLRGT